MRALHRIPTVFRETSTLLNTHTGSWTLITSALTVMLYLASLTIIALAVRLDPNLPAARMITYATALVCVSLYLVLVVAILKAYHMESREKRIREGFFQLKEGCLEARLQPDRGSPLGPTEQAFNSTMEVLERRYRSAKS